MLLNCRCTCLEGFSGTRCEINMVDPCSSSPCLNSSTCILEEGSEKGFRCECHEGFIGFYCDGIEKEGRSISHFKIEFRILFSILMSIS